MKCVLKQVSLGGLSDHDRAETLNEASILRSAQSKHVVAYIDSWEDPESDCLYIVMEHAGEDLSRVMKANGGALPEEDVWRYILPVARGLKHLHSLRILHRDLKPANIFRRAEGDAEERVVIGDLGLGRVLGAHSDFAKTGVGTPLYFSPELAQEKPYNDKSDVWAFGCLAHELLVGKPPFEAKNQLALASKIVNAPAPSLPDTVSPDLAFVIHKALTKDPERRPSMTDLLGLSCVRERARTEKARAAARAARDAETRRELLERRLLEERELLESERAAFEREKAEMESKAAALSLAVSLEDVEGMAERIRQLESANAALAARLEDTETRLTDAERARVALASKLETAVSAAASAAATPYKPASSPASAKHARGASDSFGRSPGASGGSETVQRWPPTKETTKESPSVSPPRDVPSRLAPPAHDEEMDVADELEEVETSAFAATVGVEGADDDFEREPEPRRMNDRYGAAGAEEDDASVPPSPIAPASAAESEDDAFCAEDAPGPEPSRVVSSPAPRNASVARSLLYDEDTSFGSLASFGRSPAAAAEHAADASVDSAAFTDDASDPNDATAVSLEPSVSTIQSMSVASTPRASLTRSGGRASGAEATDRPAPPPPPVLAYTNSVFRPIAPAREPRRAEPEASTTRKESRVSGAPASKPAFGKRDTAPVRPVARLPAKGGAPVDLAALGVGPLGDESAAADAEAPFAAVLAWRRARKGQAAAAPVASTPIGFTSRVWDNRAILSLAPSASPAFVVLYRCVDGGRASPLRRAKLRGRRARGDDFVSCALVSSREHVLKRTDGVAPWRCAEIVPPAGALAGLGGAWVELVLEFAAAAAVEETVVLKPDARLSARFGNIGTREKASVRTPSSSAPEKNETENQDEGFNPKPEAVELRRWPGLAGGAVRVAPAASAAASPSRESSAPVQKKGEEKTPIRNPHGVFVEGRSPDGPLASVSFTPPDRRRIDDSRDEDAPESARATPSASAKTSRGAAEPAWPLKADQVAALLRRAGRLEDDARRSRSAARGDGSEPGSEPGSEANGRDASRAIAAEARWRDKDAQTRFPLSDENQAGGYPERVVPPFEPEDRALVNDLLYQARLLQDAVSAAAERLNPANPSRLARANHAGSPIRADPEEEERFVSRRFRLDTRLARRSSRRSHKLDLLRSIGHMANPTLFSPVPDGLACESPALDARARRRPLGEPEEDGDSSERRRSGDEIVAAASFARERRPFRDPRDEDSPSSSAYGSSPAFDESASMRRRRLEGLLEPRQLF